MMASDSRDFQHRVFQSNRLWFVSAAYTALLIAVCLQRNHQFFHDDAYITLRYARHLLDGLGLTWNRRGPRVEGFTSPLHLILVAACGAVGIPLRWAACIVNFSSHAALAAFLYSYLRRRTGLIGASWMFLVWDIGGLDSVLYAALGTAGVLQGCDAFEPQLSPVNRNVAAAALLLSLATLARPEGILLIAGYSGLLLVRPNASRKPKVPLLGIFLGIVTLVLVPTEIFRWSYFHAAVPNTMYAKLGGISHLVLLRFGIRYAVHFLVTPPFIGPIAIAAACLSVKQKTFSPRDTAIWVLTGCNALFILVSGGDHMVAFRFCLLIYSLLATLLILHAKELGFFATSNGVLASFAVMIAALTLQVVPPVLNPRTVDPAAGVGQLVGRYIATHWPAGSYVALNTAGSTPYHSDSMEYIDMLGLNDAEIARRKNIPTSGPWTRLIGHLKGDGASVLARKPDYIILGPAEGTTPEIRTPVFFFGDDEISRSASFQQDYELCQVPLSADRDFTYYRRKQATQSCR
jgi:hypothetical protein